MPPEVAKRCGVDSDHQAGATFKARWVITKFESFPGMRVTRSGGAGKRPLVLWDVSKNSKLRFEHARPGANRKDPTLRQTGKPGDADRGVGLGLIDDPSIRPPWLSGGVGRLTKVPDRGRLGSLCEECPIA